MRTGSGFSTSLPTIKATFSPPAIVQRSPWHSPVPYLFGGLAAMLGLIAFALLILACSYWKLSSHLREHDDNQSQDDTEAGAGEKLATGVVKAVPEFEEKIVVIMAGDLNPSFLATPMLNKGAAATFLNKCEEKLEKRIEEKEKLEEVVIEVREESNGDSQHSHGQNQ
ncbi:PREDICTED: protein GLUTAMINE DUMPER 2-like [Nicotiana attenuata]|uniref:Protein glutamine dumper 1 n=1 Tax=Nicotiana attenuata TaxID=49451 RepID=A0A314KUM6_NICAT|nr:PREDICTED: protein GLUTAMINE DUMPER 2-like [Nicotiana attenuata]OIT33068.1 protein glutamine dumper 1 [Nicotiana attenuata]